MSRPRYWQCSLCGTRGAGKFKDVAEVEVEHVLSTQRCNGAVVEIAPPLLGLALCKQCGKAIVANVVCDFGMLYTFTFKCTCALTRGKVMCATISLEKIQCIATLERVCLFTDVFGLDEPAPLEAREALSFSRYPPIQRAIEGESW